MYPKHMQFKYSCSICGRSIDDPGICGECELLRSVIRRAFKNPARARYLINLVYDFVCAQIFGGEQ